MTVEFAPAYRPDEWQSVPPNSMGEMAGTGIGIGVRARLCGVGNEAFLTLRSDKLWHLRWLWERRLAVEIGYGRRAGLLKLMPGGAHQALHSHTLMRGTELYTLTLPDWQNMPVRGVPSGCDFAVAPHGMQVIVVLPAWAAGPSTELSPNARVGAAMRAVHGWLA